MLAPPRVHFPRLECRTDATHVLRCALGTGVRVLNWGLAASAGVSALCLAAGISRSALICRMLEVRLSPDCAVEAYFTGFANESASLMCLPGLSCFAGHAGEENRLCIGCSPAIGCSWHMRSLCSTACVGHPRSNEWTLQQDQAPAFLLLVDKADGQNSSASLMIMA